LLAGGVIEGADVSAAAIWRGGDADVHKVPAVGEKRWDSVADLLLGRVERRDGRRSPASVRDLPQTGGAADQDDSFAVPRSADNLASRTIAQTLRGATGGFHLLELSGFLKRNEAAVR
jgi:hypothetical protein